VLRKSIHLLKFGGIRRLSKPLSLLLQDLPIPGADAFVPVPLHRDRLIEREFNQSAAIARHLSKRLDIPLRLDVLRKSRKTLAQTEVTGKERRRNIKNAYAVAGEVKGLSLLLLDDIITTGATAAECAKTLVDAGAREVIVIALARSMPRQ
jgi:ComF family protein